MNKNNKPVIGLEVHVELSTNSKMFCGCKAFHFRVKPNTHTCPVCLGLPGALPVPNKKAVDWAIMIGLALNCKVSPKSKFDRKHYFYPDLPKGYQISQYDQPLCEGGFLETSEGKVKITRVHLEEDTGKLIHKKLDGSDVSLVDFNRCGVPLVEIVTEPDLRSAKQTKEFAQEIRRIIRSLGVSDCDMEKGSMRLEANMSWGLDLGYKVEIKNVNSFKFTEKAIEYDLARQKELLDKGKTPKQETRGWDEKQNITVSQRFKETAADYRYFPEPDIAPMTFTDKQIATLRKSIPELPDEIAKRLVKEFDLRVDYSQLISADSALQQYAEKVFKKGLEKKIKPNDLAGVIINQKIDIEKVSPDELVDLVFQKKTQKESDPSIVSGWVMEAIEQNSEAVTDYKNGKTNAISVIIGSVMKISSGKADPAAVRDLLIKKLA